MSWFFSGVLIVVCLGVAGFTGYLVRRLFTGAPEPEGEVGP